MLPGIGLAEDSTKDLLNIHRGSAVCERSQNVGEGAVPALLQRVDRDDIADRAVAAHQVLFLQIVHIGGFDGDLLLGDSHPHQHVLDLIVSITAFAGARLRLEQDNGANIGPARLFLQNCVLLNAAAELDRVLNHALPGGAVVDHHRQLDHVFLFQFAGVYIGDDIAVAFRGRRQIQHKGRIQIVQHLHAEIRSGVVAFIHHDHRLQMPQHLDQRRVRRVGQQRLVVFEILGKAEQVAVFLIDLADVTVAAVDAQRAVAHDAYGQHLPHGIRREVLPVEQHLFCINAHASSEILIQPLTVGMVHVRQRADRLRHDGITGDKPDHHLRFADRHSVEDPPDRGAGHKGLAAARGHLHADVGHAVDGIVVPRHTACTHSHILVKPIGPPCGIEIGVPVDRIHEGGQIPHDLFLIGFQFHDSASLELGDVSGNLLEGDMIALQLFLAECAEVGVNHIGVGAGLYRVQELPVQRGDSFPLVVEIIGVVYMQAEIIGLVRVCLRQAALGVCEIDILPDLVHADALVEHVADHQGLAQIIIAEAAARALHSLPPAAVTVDHALDTLGGDAVGIVHHLHEDELAMPAVSLVHIQNRVGSRAGTGKGVKDDRIGIGSNLQNELN